MSIEEMGDVLKEWAVNQVKLELFTKDRLIEWASTSELTATEVIFPEEVVPNTPKQNADVVDVEVKTPKENPINTSWVKPESSDEKGRWVEEVVPNTPKQTAKKVE